MIYCVEDDSSIRDLKESVPVTLFFSGLETSPTTHHKFECYLLLWYNQSTMTGEGLYRG